MWWWERTGPRSWRDGPMEIGAGETPAAVILPPLNSTLTGKNCGGGRLVLCRLQAMRLAVGRSVIANDVRIVQVLIRSVDS